MSVLPDSGGGIKGTIEETPRCRKGTITGLMGQVDSRIGALVASNGNVISLNGPCSPRSIQVDPPKRDATNSFQASGTAAMDT